jgi:hypothetical protein
MVDTKTLSRVEQTIMTFERRAHANGRTFEQEVELLLASRKKLAPEERVAVSRYFRAQHPDIQPSLTLDEIREGLM